MSHEVRLGPLAITDLIAIRRWVSTTADGDVADAYLKRVEERLATLSTFPDRGTPRDDLITGLRTLAFERRLIIAYRVDETVVTILRVVHGARDLGNVLGDA